jgi:predicted PurR-regulated permease PerM
MSIVLAYIIVPVVNLIHARTRLGLLASTGLVYVLIVAALIAIPLSAVPPLVSQANNLINNTPGYIEQIGQQLGEPIQVGPIFIPLDALHIDDFSSVISDNVVEIVQAIAPQSLRLFGATLTTVGWILIVLLLSFYMVKDYRFLWKSLVALAPENYRSDLDQLGKEASDIWNAFLRGQLVLAVIIGLITAAVAFLIGLPNALILGLLAGLLEFIPNIGPVLAAIPALLLALFQYETSWLGVAVGPIWFGLIVLFIYGIIQRLENMFLLPRIIGRSLGLHALVVLIGAIIGASVAGVFGILLAAPLLATAKLILGYIYSKLLDQPPF